MNHKFQHVTFDRIIDFLRSRLKWELSTIACINLLNQNGITTLDKLLDWNVPDDCAIFRSCQNGFALMCLSNWNPEKNDNVCGNTSQMETKSLPSEKPHWKKRQMETGPKRLHWKTLQAKTKYLQSVLCHFPPFIEEEPKGKRQDDVRKRKENEDTNSQRKKITKPNLENVNDKKDSKNKRTRMKAKEFENVSDKKDSKNKRTRTKPNEFEQEVEKEFENESKKEEKNMLKSIHLKRRRLCNDTEKMKKRKKTDKSDKKKSDTNKDKSDVQRNNNDKSDTKKNDKSDAKKNKINMANQMITRQMTKTNSKIIENTTSDYTKETRRKNIAQKTDWPKHIIMPVTNNIWDKLHQFQSIQVPQQEQSSLRWTQCMQYLYTQALSQGVQIPPHAKEWHQFLTILYSFPKLQCEILKDIYETNLDPYLALVHYAFYLPSRQQADLTQSSTRIHNISLSPRPWTFVLREESSKNKSKQFTEDLHQRLFLQLCFFACENKRILHFDQWKGIPWNDLAFVMLSKCFFGDQIPLETKFIVSKERVQEPLSKFATQLCTTLFEEGQPICISHEKFHIGQLFSELKVPADAHGFGGKSHIWMLRDHGCYQYVTFPRRHCIAYIPSSHVVSLDWTQAMLHFFTRPNIHFVASHQGKSIIAFTGRDKIEIKMISHKKTKRMQCIQLLVVSDPKISSTIRTNIANIANSNVKVVSASAFQEPERTDPHQYLVLCNKEEAKKWKRQLPETPIIRLM